MSKARSHEENRRVVCILCFKKSDGIRAVTEKQTKTIRTYFIADYDSSLTFYPSVLCGTCRIVCSQYATGNFKRTIQLHKYMRSVPVATRRNPQRCSCEICETARLGMDKTVNKTTNRKRGRPRLTVNDGEPKVAQICTKCYAHVGRGRRHDCTKTKRVINLGNILDDKEAALSGEAVVSSFLNRRMKKGESSIQLRNRRGKPSTFSKQSSQKPSNSNVRISAQQLYKLKADNNLSVRKTLSVAKSLRGHGVQFESGFRDKMSTLNRQLMNFFEISSIKSAVDNGSTLPVEDTPIIYCTDVPGLIKHIKEKRQIDNDEVLIKLGIDGGGSFFKITLSIVPTSQQNQPSSNQFKDSGVRRFVACS